MGIKSEPLSRALYDKREDDAGELDEEVDGVGLCRPIEYNGEGVVVFRLRSSLSAPDHGSSPSRWIAGRYGPWFTICTYYVFVAGPNKHDILFDSNASAENLYNKLTGTARAVYVA